MAIYPVIAARWQVYSSPQRAATHQPIGIPISVKVTLLTLVTLTILVTGVMGISRLQPLRAVIDLPPHFLPGSPIPDEADPARHSGILAHEIQFAGRPVHFIYDSEHEVIIQTYIATDGYRIGDFIAAWGTPSGFARSGRDVDVYWGSQDVYLNTCSLRPDSPVQYVAYYLDEPLAASWRGFSSDTQTDC